MSDSFETPRTVVHQGPLSMGISWQEYWNGLTFPYLGDLPESGIKPTSLVSPALAGIFFTTESSDKAYILLEEMSFDVLCTLFLGLVIFVVE